MKQKNRWYVVLIVVIMAVSFSTFSQVHSETSAVQEKALAFIENALPIDFAEYDIKLEQHHTNPEFSPKFSGQEVLIYTLESADGIEAEISCIFQNGSLTGLLVNSDSGNVIKKQPTQELISASRTFLEGYQSVTKNNLTEMIKLLPEAGSTENLTVNSGNIRLDINHKSNNRTSFSWTYTANGADYTRLGITFENGKLYAMRDSRGLYKIGNTNINITEEQAISTALKYVQNYTYTCSTHDEKEDERISFEVTGFNITQDSITTELLTTTREDSTLYPYWNVKLPLTEFYPGNVWALKVRVWADSGEAFHCSTLGVGGIITETPTNDSANELPTTSQPQIATQNMSLVATVTSIAIALGLLTIALRKRRNK